MFLLVVYIPVNIFLLIHYFFRARSKSNRMFLKGTSSLVR